MRRAAAVAALAALVTAVPAAATPTAFPARNGELTFASDTADNVMQQLFTVLPDGSDRHAVTRLPGNHYLPSWSPDGRQVAFVLQGSIGVANADGTDERTIAPNEASPPVWSHDSRELAYGRFEPDSPTIPAVWILNPDGTGATRIGPGSWPSWSPDGSSSSTRMERWRRKPLTRPSSGRRGPRTAASSPTRASPHRARSSSSAATVPTGAS